MIKVEVFCKKHPRYAAWRKPTADCLACKRLWFMFKGINGHYTQTFIDRSQLEFEPFCDGSDYKDDR
jgi:hypothetical protein